MYTPPPPLQADRGGMKRQELNCRISPSPRRPLAPFRDPTCGGRWRLCAIQLQDATCRSNSFALANAARQPEGRSSMANRSDIEKPRLKSFPSLPQFVLHCECLHSRAIHGPGFQQCQNPRMIFGPPTLKAMTARCVALTTRTETPSISPVSACRTASSVNGLKVGIN